jgi:hypothetical protein
MVRPLPSICEALDSNPTTAKHKNKNKYGQTVDAVGPFQLRGKRKARDSNQSYQKQGKTEKS